MRLTSTSIVVITGASSGIGRAMANEFASTGATVVMIARTSDALQLVADEIAANGGRAVGYVCDLADPDATDVICADIMRDHGVPDVLINNAGVGAWRPIDATTTTQLEAVMQVPVMAAFRMIRAFLPAMRARGSGHFVNMTSFAAFIAFSGAAAYLVSRHAMYALHEVLREEVRGSGITTSIAYFSKVQSEYWRHNPGSEERLPARHRMIRTLTSEEAARAVRRGVEQGREHIYAPRVLWVFRQTARLMPLLVRALLRAPSTRSDHDNA